MIVGHRSGNDFGKDGINEDDSDYFMIILVVVNWRIYEVNG